MISMFLSATAACTGWPPKVMPCVYMDPGFVNGSITRSVAITAPMAAYADDSPLADVIRSGRMSNRSEANQWPVRPKPVITSSAHSRMPCSSHSSRTPWK